MNENWKIFSLILVMCLVIQGFFAMIEMACVSFNKIRLQYYVSQGNKRAIWLNRLLQNPSRLFGTALICINLSLQVGSEASRRLYDALQINPDLAPLTQIIVVLIFAELAPLFAGRRYAEHAAMIGVPVLYLLSYVLYPFIWLFDAFCRGIHRLIGSSEQTHFYLSRDELQKILEEKDPEELNSVVSQIFSLRNLKANDLMKPLKQVELIPSICTVAEMRVLLSSRYSPSVPIYNKKPENIVAIAYPRDLLRVADNKKVRDYAKAPWFITEKDPILEILQQFRRNHQTVAIVLNEGGLAQGILTLDEIINEIFEMNSYYREESFLRKHHVIFDRSFPGDMKIVEFNQTYQVYLDPHHAETLEELMIEKIGHPPAIGETIRIDQFELSVEEVSLLGAVKTISIRTLS